VTAGPPVHPVDVFLVLHDGPALLLALRQGTGYDDGRWNLPSGKLEHGEDVLSAMVREAREEIGISLSPDSLRLATTVHRRAASHTRVGLVFAAASDPPSQGTPVNAEPHKCGGIGWFPAGSLPAEMSAYSADCIEAYLHDRPFTLSGWGS
jgi:8-oxo-dGTP pyrophosphatase MutT (NUDIX family)